MVDTVIDQQNYLEKDENLDLVLTVLKSICESLKYKDKAEEIKQARERIASRPGSTDRWNMIMMLFKKTSKPDILLQNIFLREVTLGLLYPKIDTHVSAQANHLLKCPFNVHHDTGKVSLPIQDIENFNVAECPNIFDVLADKSVMDPYLSIFDEFCNGLIDNSLVAGNHDF